MKKLVLIGLLVAACASAQTVFYKTSATLEWDAVVLKEGGAPLDPGTVIEYEVGRSAMPVADRAMPETPLGTVSATSASVTIPVVATSYAYAVRAKATVDGGATTLWSAWAWTDVEGYPVPFVYRAPSTMPPRRPQGLRNQ